MPARLSAYLALLIADGFIWGVAAVVIKYTLEYFPPYTFLTYRFWISFLIVLPFFFIELRKHRFTLSQLKEAAVLTTIGIPITLILVFMGLDRTTAIEGSFILASAPIFSVIGGVIFLKERVNRREVTGIVIVIVGTLLIILEPLFRGNGLRFSGLTGNLLLLLSNFTLAYYTLRSRRDLLRKFSPWFITIMGFIIAPIVLTPLSLFEQPLSKFPAYLIASPIEAHLGVLYMAILSGVIAYFLYQYGLKQIEASEASLFHYLGPIFGAPLAVYWLGEEITTPFMIGAILTIIGVFVAEYIPHKRQLQISS